MVFEILYTSSRYVISTETRAYMAQKTKQPEQPIGELLEGLDKDALISFLVEYADHDARFRNALCVRFCEPEFEEELDRLGREIDYALDGASDYRRRGDWGNIEFDVSDIYTEIAVRAEQGHVRLAFASLELLYRKLLELFEYQEECEIGDEVEYYLLERMVEVADKAVLPEDREYIFQHCIELSRLEDGKDYGADYEDKLLAIAAKLVTTENCAELEEALARFDSSWRAEAFKLIQLEIVRKIEGNSAADRFIARNLRFPKIREQAYEQALECKCQALFSADGKEFFPG
jgi:hypothetical protein